eukprot:3139639-Amphidinium_carterae.1
MSKVNEFDHTVPLDLDRQAWLVPLLLALSRTAQPSAPLFGVSYAYAAAAFRRLAAEVLQCKVQPTLYSLRHSGASHDVAIAARTLPAVQRRGA